MCRTAKAVKRAARSPARSLKRRRPIRKTTKTVPVSKRTERDAPDYRQVVHVGVFDARDRTHHPSPPPREGRRAGYRSRRRRDLKWRPEAGARGLLFWTSNSSKGDLRESRESCWAVQTTDRSSGWREWLEPSSQLTPYSLSPRAKTSITIRARATGVGRGRAGSFGASGEAKARP